MFITGQVIWDAYCVIIIHERKILSKVVAMKRNYLPLLSLALFLSALNPHLVLGEGVATLKIEPHLADLNTLESHNGVLNVTLEATENEIKLGGVTLHAETFNGSYVGPALHVMPGDVMNIKLINHLKKDKANLHFHGIHTSPRFNSDNIYIEVKAGDSFKYSVKISPTQPPGLYWYHTHVHGVTEKSTNGGLSGALIVGDPRKEIPELASIDNKIMVLKEYIFEKNENEAVHALHKIVQTINGQLMSSISAHPGETQLWQIANNSADHSFYLVLQDHNFEVVGLDGVTTTHGINHKIITIAPASRVAVLVTAGRVGTYELISQNVPTGLGDATKTDRVLGHLVVSGAPVPSVTAIKTFPAREDLRTKVISDHRTVVFSELNDGEHFFINGRSFSHERIDARVPLGSYEEWTIINDSDDLHVFHIHQLHFQLIEQNGLPVPFDGVYDNLTVPMHGSIKVIIPFIDPVMLGTFVYHCHVLEHEDKGMMANIEVYDPSKENFLTTIWNNTFPNFLIFSDYCSTASITLWQATKHRFNKIIHPASVEVDGI